MGTVSRLLPIVVALTVAASCRGMHTPPDARDASHAAAAMETHGPTAEEAANATYEGLGAGTVTLVNGVWEGEPAAPGATSRPRVQIVPGFHLVGDLESDGAEDAVVLLSTSTGGSGTFDYLAVLRRRGESPMNIGTADLGDRVQVLDARIANGQLVVDVIRPGPNDARCCPTEKARLTFVQGDGGLRSTGSQIVGTASLADIGGPEWVLSRFTWDESAPATPAATLQLQDESFVGRGGCNRYTGPVTAGDTAGAIKVGPIAVTFMSCDQAADALERRFLEALGAVERYGFVGGQLALTYRQGDALRTLIFRKS
jgi:heat shock protein HslJ